MTFWQQVQVGGPDECWPWLAGKQRGYGYVQVDGHRQRAHRVAYELTVGPIPEGLILDHECHNKAECSLGQGCPHRACCNPAHLVPRTPGDNLRRSANTQASLSAAKTHCPQGHPYDDANTYLTHGHRSCKECGRIRHREWWHRKKDS